jgi:hypothetical protein
MTNKETRKKFGFDFGKSILVTGTLANIPLWIGAFSSTETQSAVSEWIQLVMMPVLGSVAGMMMGLTSAAGLVFVISRLATMQPTIERKVRGKDEYRTITNTRYWMTVGVLVTLLVVSIALLSAYELGRLSGTDSLYDVLGSTWARWWAVGRVLAADLILAGVALVSGVHPGAATRSAGEQTTSGTTSGASNRSAGKSGRSPKPAKVTAIVPCRYAGAGCTRTGSQPAMNAHARACQFKPTISMPVETAQKVEK